MTAGGSFSKTRSRKLANTPSTSSSHREVVLQIPVTVTAEGGEIEAKEPKKAKAESKTEAVEEAVVETEETEEKEA